MPASPVLTPFLYPPQVYNYQITFKPQGYGSNDVYKAADVIYFVGAFLYLAASLRDCDCWFWLRVPWHPATAARLRAAEGKSIQLAERQGPSDASADTGG